MNTLTEQVMPRGRGNHSNAAKRSEDGRKGRGADAFTAKITFDQRLINQRIEAIAARQPALGMIRVSYPLHVPIETVKGVKL